MSMIRVRDDAGQPITAMAVRLSVADQDSAHAYDERFTDGAGQTAFPHPVEASSYTLHVNYTDDCCGSGHRQRYASVSVSVSSLEQDVTIIVPRAGSGGGSGTAPGPIGGDVQLIGASLYGIPCDWGWDYKTFAHILSDCGCNWTTMWLWGGLVSLGSVMPFERSAGPDSPFDCYRWNPRWFDGLKERVKYFRSYGIRPLLNFVDLYPFAQSKQGLPGIPDANKGPFRFNVNDIRWGLGSGSQPDDPFYLEAPNGGPQTGPGWLRDFIIMVVDGIGNDADYQTGNELPESALHDRIAVLIKQRCPTAKVTVSRNSDSPGQYANMVQVHHHDAINFHGWRSMAHMDEVFHEEDTTGRPNTYRKLLEARPFAANRSIIACSDGARNGNPDPLHAYDWPDLLDAFRYAKAAGCNVDHQSAAKMALFTNGTHDLGTVELDFLKQLTR